MNTRVLVWGVSLGSGAFFFALFAVLGSVAAGAIVGMAATAASFVFMTRAFGRGNRQLAKLAKRLEHESITYSGIASLTLDGVEQVGALVVTTQRVAFEASNKGQQALQVECPTENIERAGNDRGFFVMVCDDGSVFRFKVFECDRIVSAVRNRQE